MIHWMGCDAFSFNRQPADPGGSRESTLNIQIEGPSGWTNVWTVFDTAEAICGLGCYQDDLLFAITQHDPVNPGPFYLHTWNLTALGIPMLPADVYQLGEPFTGSMGGCEWDGEYLWILDQNFVLDADEPIIYKYDVDTHSVVSSWSYSELGGVGIACVWDAVDLRIWKVVHGDRSRRHSFNQSYGNDYSGDSNCPRIWFGFSQGR